MNAIYAIGETVYDIIFRNDQPVAARPGGSMLNTAISLGRSGLKVEMITELGDDPVGKLVTAFLNDNGVSTSFIQPAGNYKTPVSLAFLDDSGDARYSFYKNIPEKRLNIGQAEAGKGDVVLFGSFYSLDAGIRHEIISFINKSKQNGALIFYDPNIRKNHLGEINKLMPSVEENISLADIIRGSDEDFFNLFGLDDQFEIAHKVIQSGCHHMVITRGKHGADYLSRDEAIHFPAIETKAVSTIGAGDAFNAGIIYAIIKNDIPGIELVNINSATWKTILRIGTIFAAEVCKSYDNYIGKDFASQMNEENYIDTD
ncbi:MAG TPA: carbohydrate kinase [Bacteroidales bacterium]|jgi:fructokinase|nr:carbohydrate kinase [Bacteroidales bacterium]HOX76837.1 carbohydrate kinase [Bacteroidales bacterium]HPI86632.1 carbohydrate kinase [Bacteroidales bacterium]HPM92313.1 carbohydrate kinase [Bacteroidales bacterium]